MSFFIVVMPLSVRSADAVTTAPVMAGIVRETPSFVIHGPDVKLRFIAAHSQIGRVILVSGSASSAPSPTPKTSFSAVYPDPTGSVDYFSDMTSKNTDPEQAVPLWLWEQGPTAPSYTVSSSDPVHITLNLGQYPAPVDVYVGLQIPDFSSGIYLFGEEGSLHSLSKGGLVKYESSVISVKTDILTLSAGAMSQLKEAYPDPWNFYVLVVPAGSIDNGTVNSYYLWRMTY